MSNIVSRSQTSGPPANQAANGSAGRSRNIDGYNRSSLALEFADTAFPSVQPLPQLVAKRGGPAGQDARSSMFKSLDQYASNRDRGSGVLAFLIHLLVILTVLWVTTIAQSTVVQSPDTAVLNIPFTLYDPPPPPVMPVAKVQGGGGGGGAHHMVAPVRGNLPKVAKLPPIVKLEPARIEIPKLPVEPTMQIKMPQNTAMPNLGMPQSPQVAMASQGPGSNSGFGFGMDGGAGSGHGSGIGPGSNGGYGGGVMNVGGGVSAPQVIHSVDPQFTEEARQANHQGVVSIQLIVDPQGSPQNVHVVRILGMGLDQRAVEAVRQYRFRPAMYQGRPVAVQMVIDVEFRLH